MWQLFLDDERFPDDILGWMFARSVDKAIELCNIYGCPSFISFDHDLGEVLTGKDFACWLVGRDLDEQFKFIPDDFDFYVHSQNPVGAKNIHDYLTQYFEFVKLLKIRD